MRRLPLSVFLKYAPPSGHTFNSSLWLAAIKLAAVNADHVQQNNFSGCKTVHE